MKLIDGVKGKILTWMRKSQNKFQSHAVFKGAIALKWP